MLTAFFASCQNQDRWMHRLDEVDALIPFRVDSALTLLEQMKGEVADAPEAVNYRYQLLQIKALSKSGKQQKGKESIINDIVEYYEQADDQRYLPDAYFQAGRIYTDMPKRALLFYQMALQCDSAYVSDYLKSRIFAQTGYIFLSNNMLDEAIDMQVLAQQYCKAVGDTLGERYCQEDIATITAMRDTMQLDSVALTLTRQTIRAVYDKARFSMLKMRADREKRQEAERNRGLLFDILVGVLIIVAGIILGIAYGRKKRKLQSDSASTSSTAPGPNLPATDLPHRRFYDAEISQLLSTRIAEEKALTPSQWQQIEQSLLSTYPDFRNALYSLFELSENEYHVCMLIKMEVAPSAMAQLLSTSKSSISQMRLRMQRKAYGEQGGGKDWDNFVLSL